MLRWCIFASALALACSTPLFAQSGGVGGVVRDGHGVAVPVTVVEALGPTRATVETDSLGRYRIAPLAPGDYVVRATRLGYDAAELRVHVQADRLATADFTLAEQALAVEGVRVEVSRERQRFEGTAGTTARQLTGEEMRSLPGLAEPDIVRAVDLLPGVVTTSDFSSAFNVRGGSADENLILLDGFPIYNPFHLGGLFSVFNGDMVRQAELLEGGFPPRYGNRVSSVLRVDSDPGGAGFEGSAGISALAARLALGQDLSPGAASRLGLRSGRGRVSFRRSYVDAVLKPVVDFPYHLQDAQGYFEGWTRGGGQWVVTAYTGDDVLDFGHATASFPLRLRWAWGNDVVGARYTGSWGRGRVLELQGGYSGFGTSLRFPDFGDTRFDSRIGQLNLQADAAADVGGGTHLELGGEANHFAYDDRLDAGGAEFARYRDDGWLVGAYAQAHQRSGAWLVEGGLRGDAWSPRSGGTFAYLSPRVGVKRFIAGGQGALKLAAGRYTQVLHSVRDEQLPLGLDIWVMAGQRAPAVISDQVQGGVEALTGQGWRASLEGYWRDFRGVVANNYAEDPNDPSDDFLRGRGRSYGVDFLLKREVGPVNGWISASWLRATRTFPDYLAPAGSGAEVSYAPLFDRRIDLDLVLRYPLPGGIEGGLHWSYGSGLPYTSVFGAYSFYDYELLSPRVRPRTTDGDPVTAILLGPRNGARYPPYHRLDLSFRKTYTRPWGSITPYLQVLNAYNRKNPLFYFFNYDLDPPTRTGVSMFPFLPTFGADVTF
ncbi:MAG: TonB-dependent receptor [Gemmatimonadetes bacterium]|nr:TonB-dependent receptor [Gemmatimonadota bacterium]